MPPKKSPPRLDDVMTDLETLDTAVTGVILSIGACKFNADEIGNEGFYRKITIESNLEEGRTISPSTLRWWMQQSDAAREAAFSAPGAIPLGQALDEFREWLGTDKISTENMRPWGNGSDFDIAMLAHAYGRQGTPWKFYNVRCFRTIKSDPRWKDVPKPAPIIAHHALYDAIAQAQHLQAIWKEQNK